MLHYDIIRQISLYCKQKIFSINKELNNMYNKIWFEDKLQLYHPGIKLYTPTNYHDLYKKYMNQGKIAYYGNFININRKLTTTAGIKAMKCGDNYYILTFNGDLYKESNGIIILIDTQVIDIGHRTYIKQYDWFVWRGDFVRVNLTPSQRFIKIADDSFISYVLTSGGIYYYEYWQSLPKFYPIDNIVDLFNDGYSSFVMDNNAKRYICGILNDIPELLLCDDDEPLNYNELSFMASSLDVYAAMRLMSKYNIYLPQKETVQKCIKSTSYVVILSNNNVFIYEIIDDIIDKLLITIPHSINIFHCYDGIFVVTKSS